MIQTVFYYLAASALAFALTTSVLSGEPPRTPPGIDHQSELGKPAPSFALKGASGTSHELLAYQGKYVVLEWTSYFCPCVKKFYDSGQLPAFQKRMRAEMPLVWFQVTSTAPGRLGYLSPAEAPAAQLEIKSEATDLLLDHEGVLGRAYGAKTTPHFFVIDPQGILIYEGSIDDRTSVDPADLDKSKNYVRLALEDHAAGKPVRTPVTKSYGCPIKYKAVPSSPQLSAAPMAGLSQ
jgi:hypothetical protein